MEGNNKSIKVLNLLGLIFGLVGAGFSALALFLPAYTVSTFLGKISMSMLKDLSVFAVVYIAIVGFGIMTALLKRGVLSIINGSVSLLLCIIVIADAESKASGNALVNNMLSYGAGIYLMVFAAALIITAGILFIIAANKRKSELTEEEIEKEKKLKKKCAVIFSSVYVGMVVLAIVAIFITAFATSKDKKEVKSVAENFMNAAVSADVDTINGLVSSNVKDRYGFLEAYDAELLRDSFMLSLGGPSTYALLSESSQQVIMETMRSFGFNYVQSYSISDVKYDSEKKTGTVVVNVVMHNENGISSVSIEDGVAQLTNDYITSHATEIAYTYQTEGEVAALVRAMNAIMPESMELVKESNLSKGTMNATITLTIEMVNDSYLITAIEVSEVLE